jgi:hypothetical protein
MHVIALKQHLERLVETKVLSAENRKSAVIDTVYTVLENYKLILILNSEEESLEHGDEIELYKSRKVADKYESPYADTGFGIVVWRATEDDSFDERRRHLRARAVKAISFLEKDED